MVTTRLGLAAIAALLCAAGCNQILGTTPPLPFGEGGATPCGDAEWTHWDPTATHVYDTTVGDDGKSYVTDGLTRLAWATPPSTDVVTWDEASTYCNGLAWGGRQDYRLPTLAELASLTRYDLTEPALDPAAFPGVAAGSSYWTSTAAHGDSVYVVSHGDGSISTSTKISTAGAWCVHDLKPPADTACARFTLTDSEQAVRDVETGLVWQRAQSGGMVDWDHAQTTCKGLPIGGHQWRVPEVAELVSLLDVEVAGPPRLDPSFFGGEPDDYYWTATVDASKPKADAWDVDVDTGATAPGVKTDTHYVRCVR